MTTQEEKQLIQNLTEDILKTYQINILHDGIEDIVKKLNGVIIKNKSIQSQLPIT